MLLRKIIGKKVKTIRGFRGFAGSRRITRKNGFIPQYILFDDKKTLIELDDQDYYAYHDCSTSAKEIRLVIDKKRWSLIYKNRYDYPVADMDILKRG
jgi:hypothetical protein